MERIKTPTRVTNKFGDGPFGPRDGFGDGNPGLGVPSTQLEADWFDQLQEEIARVVENTGTTLDGTNMEQLWEALTGDNGFVRKTGDTMTGPLIVQPGFVGADIIAARDNMYCEQAVGVATSFTGGEFVLTYDPIGNTRIINFYLTEPSAYGFGYSPGTADGGFTWFAGSATRVLRIAESNADMDLYGMVATKRGSDPLWELTTLRDLPETGPFTRGLADIIQLNPIVVDHPIIHPHSGQETERQEAVSLRLDDLRLAIPETVKDYPPEHRGLAARELPDTVVNVNLNPVFYAFINAFKEVDSRLHALENR